MRHSTAAATHLTLVSDRHSAPGGVERIAVIVGGDAHHHQAATVNGQALAETIRAVGCEPVVLTAGERLPQDLVACGARIAIPAVLDVRCLDGAPQRLCADVGVKCLGLSAAAMQACADKAATTARLAEDGVRVPLQRRVGRAEGDITGVGAVAPHLVNAMGGHVKIKPCHGFGGFGVKDVRDGAVVLAAITNALSYGDAVVMERAVAGRELRVLMTGAKGGPLAVGIADVEPPADSALAGVGRRYTAAQTLDERDRRAVVATARAAGLALGCEGLFMVDVILDAKGAAWVIEVDGMLDWRAGGALAACLESNQSTRAELLESLLNEARPSVRRVA